MRSLALDLDAVLVDTRPIWRDWIEDAARRTRVSLEDLPEDRVAAAALLVFLVSSYRDWEGIGSEHVLDPLEAVGAGGFVVIGLAALVAVSLAFVAARSSAATPAFPVTIHAANGDIVVKARPTG